MDTKNNRGGKRTNAGRKKGTETEVLSYRVPVSVSAVIDKEIKALITKHTNIMKAQSKVTECGCTVIGYTATGKEIKRVCSLHK